MSYQKVMYEIEKILNRKMTAEEEKVLYFVCYKDVSILYMGKIIKSFFGLVDKYDLIDKERKNLKRGLK